LKFRPNNDLSFDSDQTKIRCTTSPWPRSTRRPDVVRLARLPPGRFHCSKLIRQKHQATRISPYSGRTDTPARPAQDHSEF